MTTPCARCSAPRVTGSYCAPCHSARMRDWQRANPARAAEIQRDSRKRHRAVRTAGDRRYVKAHPEVQREAGARYRAKKRNAPAVEKIDRLAIFRRDHGICHLCRRVVSERRFVLDHLDPLSLGGEHTARNLAVAHQSCNASRGAGRIPAQLRLVG